MCVCVCVCVCVLNKNSLLSFKSSYISLKKEVLTVANKVMLNTKIIIELIIIRLSLV